MLTRTVLALLIVLLVLVQARLWVSDDGFRGVARLHAMQAGQQEENARLTQRNQRLEAEVRELRSGQATVEERARADLGLINKDETFYLFRARPAPGQGAGHAAGPRADRPDVHADGSTPDPRG